MTYNKSRIMKRAHYFRKNATFGGFRKEMTMAEALRAAWAEAKRENARMVKNGVCPAKVNLRVAQLLEAAERELAAA